MYEDEKKSTGIHHHTPETDSRKDGQLKAPPYIVSIGIPLLFGVACFIAFRLFLLIGNMLGW
jgi:hypothetical protein